MVGSNFNPSVLSCTSSLLLCEGRSGAATWEAVVNFCKHSTCWERVSSGETLVLLYGLWLQMLAVLLINFLAYSPSWYWNETEQLFGDLFRRPDHRLGWWVVLHPLSMAKIDPLVKGVFRARWQQQTSLYSQWVCGLSYLRRQEKAPEQLDFWWCNQWIY